MKHVISASRRTDIPAFYLNWFVERIKQGFVEVRNPFFPQNTKRVDLSPQQVEWIVFWSRNYAHFLRKRDHFADYQLYFHFTILSPSVFEKSPMPLAKQLQQLEQLVSLYGAQRINWRYDPLLFWQEGQSIQSNFKAQEFAFLAKEISALGLERCTISVATPYQKFKQRLKQRLPHFRLLSESEPIVRQTVTQLVEIAQTYNIQIEACCSDFLLTMANLKKAACIDGQRLNQLSAQRVSQAKAPSRAQCACTRSIDIGDYQKQPCYFGCMYCYANPVWK